MKTVAIPMENKVREFDGKLWLALTLASRGYEVVLGPSWEIKPTIDLIEPDVYLAKDAGDGNVDFFKKLRGSNIIVCGIPAESPVNDKTDLYAQHHSEIINYIDAFFEWGEEPADAIRDYYDKDRDKIKVTGNPRFDLLTRDLVSIYTEAGDKIQDEYGDYILVNTNFGTGNPVNRTTVMRNIRNAYPQRDPIKHGKVQSRKLYALLELILYLDLTDIDHNIIVRPHPGEDFSLYERVFGHYNEVFVRHEGDVRPWIQAADGVIHTDCTTGSESAIMKTPVMSYQPLPDVTNDESVSQTVSKSSTTREEVEEWVREYVIPKKDHEMDAAQKTAVKKYFPNVDQLAARKMCNIIDSLVEDTTGYAGYGVSTQTKIERQIKASPFDRTVLDVYDWARDLKGGNEYRKKRAKVRRKFPGIKESEIRERHRKFSNETNLSDIDLINSPKTRYTYKITRK